MARSPSGESVLERTVRILEAFDPDTTALTVGQLARRAHLPTSTASRLAAELVSHGLLRRDRQRRVRIGVRLWELAQRASPTLGLRDAALPVMQDLHAVVGQHVQLGVLQYPEVLIVERLSAPDAVINYSRVAGRLLLHASSSGLVLLANASPDLQQRVLDGPLPTYTDATPSTAKALRARLDEVRRIGVALCPGYIHPDATGIAAPIRDPAGRVVAALSVVVPNDDDARTHVPALLAGALAVRRAMGARAAPATD